MQSLNLATHIVNAIYIIRTNTIILWFLGFIGITSSINSMYPENPFHVVFVFIFITSAIFATPIIYGIYYEIIEDTCSSVTAIAKKYVLQYTWLLLRLYLPIVLFAALPMLANGPEDINPAGFQMIIVFCSLLFIYIVPYFYVSGKQQGSVIVGLQFLFKNLAASAPLIRVALLTESTLLLFQTHKDVISQVGELPLAFAEFCIYMSANIIDFILFITMIFILRTVQQLDQTDDHRVH